MPGIEPIDVISSDESSSLDGDTKINDGADAQQLSLDSTLGQPIKEMTFEGILVIPIWIWILVVSYFG